MGQLLWLHARLFRQEGLLIALLKDSKFLSKSNSQTILFFFIGTTAPVGLGLPQ
jgi:hypothetical protein